MVLWRIHLGDSSLIQHGIGAHSSLMGGTLVMLANEYVGGSVDVEAEGQFGPRAIIVDVF